MRTVVITGGTKGMGQDIARAFHHCGAQVFVAAREDNGFAANFANRMQFIKCDVTRWGDALETARIALAQTGRLDVFINNAGFSAWMPLLEVEEQFWDAMISTNLKGVFLGCQAAATYMRAGGVIINMSSIAAKRGTANNSVYCATKFGITGITQALAKELGPRGIRINAVCPVLVATDGLLVALEGKHSPAAGGEALEFLESFAATQAALRRLPTGAEVGEACLFLASPSASAITGQSINVDCGVLPQ